MAVVSRSHELKLAGKRKGQKIKGTWAEIVRYIWQDVIKKCLDAHLLLQSKVTGCNMCCYAIHWRILHKHHMHPM